MTAPRRVLPGVTYLVTRRCSERRFFLRPSKATNDVFLFLLAVAARRHEIEVHAACVMSNHYHLVLTDPHARLPAFHQYLHALVARALNASIGRWDGFWDRNSYSAVPLESPDDVVDKAAYVLANPAAAGLVRSGREWPGLWSAPERTGGEALELARPEDFFDPGGSLPEKESLRFTAPPGFTAEQYRERLLSRLAELEAQAERDHRGRFLGVGRVVAQNPAGRPSSFEPRRGLNPRVAGRDPSRRIEALRRLKEFLSSYRSAWCEWRAGNEEVVFPYGTYLLRVLHGVPCAAPG